MKETKQRELQAKSEILFKRVSIEGWLLLTEPNHNDIKRSNEVSK